MIHLKSESSSCIDKVIAMTTHKSPPNTCLQLLLSNPLNANKANFLKWLNNTKAIMAAEDLAVFFYADTVEGLLDVLKWQALLIFRRHLDPFLQQQHIQVENLVEL